jgi:hypothetical protein
VAFAADIRDQSQAKTEICAEQRFAGNYAGSSEDDIVEFGDGERGLADVIIADIIRQDGDAQGIQGLEVVREQHFETPSIRKFTAMSRLRGRHARMLRTAPRPDEVIL